MAGPKLAQPGLPKESHPQRDPGRKVRRRGWALGTAAGDSVASLTRSSAFTRSTAVTCGSWFMALFRFRQGLADPPGVEPEPNSVKC